MPSGGTYTIDTADLSAMDLSVLRIYSMPDLDTAWTIASGDFEPLVRLIDLRMQSNVFTQAQVDEILYGMYLSSIAPRVGTAGFIDVGGTNAAPSGTFQPASSCPVTAATDGNEVAHELLNDGCAAGFNVWTTVITS